MGREIAAFGVLLALLGASAAPRADVDAELLAVLAAPAPPAGVVFELVSGDEAALATALPRIRDHAARLRERFPELPIAVLSHGREQFSLLARSREAFGELHALAERLPQEASIRLQVCGNHAAARDLDATDFPSYVEVVAAAPAALASYQAAGYALIRMR